MENVKGEGVIKRVKTMDILEHFPGLISVVGLALCVYLAFFNQSMSVFSTVTEWNITKDMAILLVLFSATCINTWGVQNKPVKYALWFLTGIMTLVGLIAISANIWAYGTPLFMVLFLLLTTLLSSLIPTEESSQLVVGLAAFALPIGYLLWAVCR